MQPIINISHFYSLDYVENGKRLILEIDFREPVIYLSLDLIRGYESPYDNEIISLEEKHRIINNIYTYLKKRGYDNVKLMCDCDERIGLDINSLKTFDEMKSFFSKQVKSGFFESVEVEKPYYVGVDITGKKIEWYADKWYRCNCCGTVWEFDYPDFPAKGFVRKICDCNERIDMSISSFKSLLEVKDFLHTQLKRKIFREVEVLKPYSQEIDSTGEILKKYADKWYCCNSCEMIWEFKEPFPEEGFIRKKPQLLIQRTVKE